MPATFTVYLHTNMPTNGEKPWKKAERPADVKQTDSTHGEKETQSSNEESLPKPQGIGMAVALDWGLAVQILVTPFLTSAPGNLSLFKSLKLSQPLLTGLLLLISLPFVALIGIFGEGVRRGWQWTRPIQIVFNTLLTVGGLVQLFSVWQSVKTGNYWPLATSVILLIFSPLIAWRMSRPTTAKWFATVTSAQARKRHGGVWPWLILIWSIVGGILQTLASIKR